ncbi:MAG: ankyrin repeat domain-containing protein [Gammaproteobacteria bacterium]|nr:ankyrin repeat domain-containing protein [Gammaproteobacteria bacterium]
MAILLNWGADVNARNDHGVTPLHLVAECPHNQDILPLLFDHGAYLEARDEQGRTPLHWAAGAPCSDDGGLALLLRCGADASARDKAGWTPADLVEASECRAWKEQRLREEGVRLYPGAPRDA